jgi:beta-aspartyl-peptidase (threonine type)
MDGLHRQEHQFLRVTDRLVQSTGRQRGSKLRFGLRFVCGGLVVSEMALFAVGCGFQRQNGDDVSVSAPTGGGPGLEIGQMLASSSQSWNAGDLEGFLDDYWQSPDLTFSGATGVSRGWDEVRERYLASYWAPGAERDSLRFEELEVTPLGPTYALALGKFVLFQPQNGGKVSSSGHFSLVLRRTDEGWKIMHDHTSTTPVDEVAAGSGDH